MSHRPLRFCLKLVDVMVQQTLQMRAVCQFKMLYEREVRLYRFI